MYFKSNKFIMWKILIFFLCRIIHHVLIISCRWTLKVEPIERKNYGIYLQKTDLFFSGHDNNNNNNEMATNCFRRGLSTMENEFTNFNVMAIFFLLHYIKLSRKVSLIFLKRGHRFSATTDQRLFRINSTDIWLNSKIPCVLRVT